MLEDLISEFDSISKAQWLEKIDEDLRKRSQASREELVWDYQDFKIDPFAHADDLSGHFSTIPFSGTWQAGEYFSIDTLEDPNGAILEALNHGIEVILLDLSTPVDWDTALQNVQLDLIHVVLKTPQVIISNITQTFIAYCKDQRTQPISFSVGTHELLTAVEIKRMVPGECRLQVSSEIHLLVENMVQQLRRCVPTKTGDLFSSQVELVVQMGHTYLIEIPRLRALRILWYNLQKALGADPVPAFIEAHVSEALDGTVYDQMIATVPLALAAIYGGADRLVIRPNADDGVTDKSAITRNSALQRRVARNVHHILRYESKFDQLEDPVSGAYYFELVTKQIVEKVWKRLTDEMDLREE